MVSAVTKRSPPISETSIPILAVSCGLSLLWFSPCSEGFSRGSPVFLPPFVNSNSIWTSGPMLITVLATEGVTLLFASFFPFPCSLVILAVVCGYKDRCFVPPLQVFEVASPAFLGVILAASVLMYTSVSLSWFSLAMCFLLQKILLRIYFNHRLEIRPQTVTLCIFEQARKSLQFPLVSFPTLPSYRACYFHFVARSLD